MSEIKTDKLTGYSNKNTVTVEDGATTMTIRQGLAKMYATADTDTGNDIYGSLNISSLEDNAVGYHRFNTTNAFANTIWSAQACGTGGGTSSGYASLDSLEWGGSGANPGRSTTKVSTRACNGSSANDDHHDLNIAGWGDLA
ncbi:MAG: hypothetical protein CMO44_11030 [Verrucomicrobiales bacterium]|nr:hypothetical protein [Verrucomicrobiales bacterium]